MIVYNILRYFLYIQIFVVSIFNKKIRNFFRKRLFQKLENKSFLFENERAILLHVSSVGEFNLAKELIEKLLKKNEKIIISVMTDTGKERVVKEYDTNKNIKIIFFPLDDYFLIKKLYKIFPIKKTIIIETEIWPNLYSAAQKNSELYIVNGRLTEKKMKSYMKIKKLVGNTLSKPKKIMVQSEEDRERYLNLGVDEKKLKVFKNLKYSINYEVLSENVKKEYYEKWVDKNKKVIVCGSTRPEEEKIWLKVLKKINNDNIYQLILVPRHLERIDEIVGEIKNVFENEKNYSLLSENKKSTIIVVDKMGVLRDFYQLADFVFVGGTLVDIGGHSVLESLYYGKLPIIGPYYQNIEEIVKDAEKINFIKIVKDKFEIIEYLQKAEIVNTSEFFKKNNEINKILENLYE